MSMTMSPMSGLGSNGGGMGGAGAGISLPMLLMAMQQQQGGQQGQQQANPMSGMMQHSPGNNVSPGGQMPMPPNQQPQQLSSVMPQMMPMLLQMLSRGQTGVTPQQNPAQGGGNGMMPSIMNMLQGYQANGMPGQGMMNGLMQQAQGNINGGGAGL